MAPEKADRYFLEPPQGISNGSQRVPFHECRCGPAGRKGKVSPDPVIATNTSQRFQAENQAESNLSQLDFESSVASPNPSMTQSSDALGLGFSHSATERFSNTATRSSMPRDQPSSSSLRGRPNRLRFLPCLVLQELPRWRIAKPKGALKRPFKGGKRSTFHCGCRTSKWETINRFPPGSPCGPRRASNLRENGLPRVSRWMISMDPCPRALQSQPRGYPSVGRFVGRRRWCWWWRHGRDGGKGHGCWQAVDE